MCNPPPLLSLCNTLCITLCNTSPPPSLPQALMAVLASHRVIQSSAAVRGRLPTLLLPLAIHLHLLPTYSQGETQRHKDTDTQKFYPPPSYLFTGGNTKTKRHRHIELLSTFSSFLLYSQGGNQTHKDTEKEKDTGKHKDKEQRRIEILEQKQQWNEGLLSQLVNQEHFPFGNTFCPILLGIPKILVLQSRGVKIQTEAVVYTFICICICICICRTCMHGTADAGTLYSVVGSKRANLPAGLPPHRWQTPFQSPLLRQVNLMTPLRCNVYANVRVGTKSLKQHPSIFLTG